MNRTHCYEWFKQFKDSRHSTQDKLCSGWPSSCDDTHFAQVREIVRCNRLTVWEMAEDCNVSLGSCHDKLTTKLEMHPIVSKFVP
jgi:transposase